MALALSLSLVFSVLLLATGAAVAAYRFKYRRPNRSKVDGDDPEKAQSSTGAAEDSPNKDASSTADGVRRYGREEIQRLTSDFSSTVIGEGGFSTVYLVTLADQASGALGAVKVHRESERLYRAFKAELDVLLRARRHDNIVRLVGYCDDGERVSLVFEYVPNGTLHDKLHGGGAAVLSWSQRLSVAYELARAVDHLHENCHLPVVHNDIKPSNVLLDDRLHCKLCDFGSARTGFSSAVLLDATRAASPARCLPVVGSPGYVDPHYLRTGVASKKGDVYSFGVVVLELVTGMEAFCSEEERMLTAAMGPWLRLDASGSKRVEDVVDPRLAGDYDVGEAKAMMALVSSCIGEKPSLRPSMAEVLKAMDGEVSASISAVRRKRVRVGLS